MRRGRRRTRQIGEPLGAPTEARVSDQVAMRKGEDEMPHRAWSVDPALSNTDGGELVLSSCGECQKSAALFLCRHAQLGAGPIALLPGADLRAEHSRQKRLSVHLHATRYCCPLRGRCAQIV